MLSRRLLSLAMVLWIAASQAAAATDIQLQKKLLEMRAQEQDIRSKFGPVYSSRGHQSDEFKTLAAQMAAIDSKNLAELERIVQQYGWPGTDLVGADASNAAFLILQHAPLARQNALLPLFRRAVAAGNARAADLALLEDRILVGEGKKQLYGSQVTAGPDGVPRLHPIEDPDNVDSRRSAVGLPPLKEYLEHLERQIGKPIERQ
jgi:hypothetical protein